MDETRHWKIDCPEGERWPRERILACNVITDDSAAAFVVAVVTKDGGVYTVRGRDPGELGDGIWPALQHLRDYIVAYLTDPAPHPAEHRTRLSLALEDWIRERGEGRGLYGWVDALDQTCERLARAWR